MELGRAVKVRAPTSPSATASNITSVSNGHGSQVPATGSMLCSSAFAAAASCMMTFGSGDLTCPSRSVPRVL